MTTVAWMVTGLIQAKTVSLGAWVLYVHSRANFAASTIRRFRRFLDNERIAVNQLYGPLLSQALLAGDHRHLYVALDTSLLWNRYCVVRLALIYRGRAIPLVWQVVEHASTSVSLGVYQELLDQAAQ